MKISVSIITYNHEDFIGQAIDSVLMQQVNFDYEIVIGEDCSTDHTRDILLDYERRYPDRIRLLLHEKNLGIHLNAIQTLQACQGEYIAALEGDDYWTSPHKLQKQVDFLDSHPECVICFHNAVIFDEEKQQEVRQYCRPDQKEISTIEDLLVANFIPTCSVMYRNGLIGQFPDEFKKLPMGDWVSHILMAQYGKIGYINEVMGGYRVHAGGAWSGVNPVYRLQMTFEFYDAVDTYLNFKYDKIIKANRLKHWDSLAQYLAGEANNQSSVQAAEQFMAEQFENWPDKLPSPPQGWKSQILSKIYAHFGFDSYSKHDLATTRYCWLRAIRYDPSWLRNRGVWSICIEAYLNLWLVDWLRRGNKASYPSK